MTLILTVNGPESIWLVADRRVSYKNRPPKDDACKVMFLETLDGVAILGYTGLGATALGSEPADWMSAVLRGRPLQMEQSLIVLAKAVEREFPPHLTALAADPPIHQVAVPAFVGGEARIYSISLVLSPDRKNDFFLYTRHVVAKATPKARTPRIAIFGSGTAYLLRDKRWIRKLLRVVRAYDRGAVTSRVVADQFASINNEVHLGTADKSVGPRCIVAWRHKRGGVHKGGGGHAVYTGTERDARTPPLPTIANGMDVRAIAEITNDVILPVLLEALQTGGPMKVDVETLKQRTAQLPDKPDENLR